MSDSRVRLISGRNNPGYSFGNDTPLEDIQKTGSQVLQIWNARVEEATQQFPQLRAAVLIREVKNFRFKMFEYTPVQFDPGDYVWSFTKSGKTINGHTVEGNVHTFVWQSHGSQFTILRPVSGSARSFSIKQSDPIDQLNPQQVLANIGYAEDWVTFL